MNEELALVVVVTALVIGVYLSAIRLALNELSPGSIRKLESVKPSLADLLSTWYARRERYRITVRLLQVCVIAAVLISWGDYIRATTGTAAGDGGTPLGWIALVALAYIAGTELIGCGLARAFSRQILRVGMPPITLLALPLVFIIRPIELWHQLLTLRRMGGDSEDETATTEDEIMSLVEKDELTGGSSLSLEEDERRMIKGIFDLDETLVREIMTPRVDLDALPVESGLSDVKRLIVDSGHSRIPIYSESIDEIVGVIHAKDLLTVGSLEEASLADVMHEATFIPESKNVGDLLGEFQESIAHFAVVVDEYGGTAGVVTLEDILEEIVGEIRDEYDRDEEDTVPKTATAGEMTVDARTPICDVNDMLHVEIPDDEDFDTIGGYISFALGHIPKVGEVVLTDEVSVEVLEADERRVLKARLKKLEESEEAGAVKQEDKR